MKAYSNALREAAQPLSSYADFIALAVIALLLGVGAGTPVFRVFTACC